MPPPRQLGAIDIIQTPFCPAPMVAYATDSRPRAWIALLLSFIPTVLFSVSVFSDRWAAWKDFHMDFDADAVIAFDKMADKMVEEGVPWQERVTGAFWIGVERLKEFWGELREESWTTLTWIVAVLATQLLVYLIVIGMSFVTIYQVSQQRKQAEFKAIAHGREIPKRFPPRPFHFSDFFLAIIYPPMAIAMHCSWHIVVFVSTVSSFWSQWWLIKYVLTPAAEAAAVSKWSLARDVAVYGLNVAVAIAFIVIDHVNYNAEPEYKEDTDSVSSASSY